MYSDTKTIHRVRIEKHNSFENVLSLERHPRERQNSTQDGRTPKCDETPTQKSLVISEFTTSVFQRQALLQHRYAWHLACVHSCMLRVRVVSARVLACSC